MSCYGTVTDITKEPNDRLWLYDSPDLEDERTRTAFLIHVFSEAGEDCETLFDRERILDSLLS